MLALVFAFRGIRRDQLAIPVPDIYSFFMNNANQLKRSVKLICL